MPGDVDTAASPHSALNRPQRRGKVAVEIYKPPAARQHRQPALQQQTHNHTSPQPRYNNTIQQQQPPQQYQQQQQPSNQNHQQQQQQAPGHQYHQQQQQHIPNVNRNSASTPQQAVQQQQQHYHQQQQSAPIVKQQSNKIPSKSPRSNRRRAAAGSRGAQHNDRSSCPPEILPSPQPSKPSQQHKHPATNNASSGTSCQQEHKSVSNDSSNGLRMPNQVNGNTNSEPNGIADGIPVPSTQTITSSKQDNSVTKEANSEPVANNMDSSKSDLRDYLNIKRSKEGQEIKNLSEAVDMLSNKYFNNTASPYRGYNSAPNNNKLHINNCFDKLSLNDNDKINQFDHPRYVGNRQQQQAPMCDARRGRPDQVLYVPRGRRQTGGSSAHYTSDMNHYNNSRSSPLTEHYQNCRPPSPAFSITSVVSEFSGRHRYDGANYGQSISRPSSRMSIYDGEDEKISGKPPHYDRRNNSSRESTPGYGKTDGANARFNRQTMQLIERCINQDTDSSINRNSGMYDAVDENNQENYNSLPSKIAGHYQDDHFGRASKSPTPNRDSIHSKENVMHPMEGSPKRRRSRKNRKRRSQSRDHSFDSINKDSGSQSNLSNSGRGGGCTFYNSNISARCDGSVSLSGSRASSRNPSLERNIQDDWRQQKPLSHPNSPIKTTPHLQNSSCNNLYSSCGNSFNSSHSDSIVCDTPSPAPSTPTHHAITHRRNSADKPPTGRPGSYSGDGRRDSFSKVSSPTSPTSESSSQQMQSFREFHNRTLLNNSNTVPDDIRQESSNHQQISTEPTPSNSPVKHIHSPSDTLPPSLITENVSSSFQPDSVPENLTSSETLPADLDNEEKAKDSAFDELCSEYMSMDWAAEIEKEDLRLQNIRDGCTEEEQQQTNDYHYTGDDTSSSNKPVEDSCRSSILQKEPCSPANINRNDRITESNELPNDSCSPVVRYVDDSTRKEIRATIGRETTIEKPKQDYSRYQSSPPRKGLYTPPNGRHSPLRGGGGLSCNGERYSPPHSRSAGRVSPPSYNGSNSPPFGDKYSSSSDHSDGGGTSSPPSALAHVLELYDFPSSFRNQDLLAVYQGYQAAAPLDIKWVDDTHALVVFCTAAVAAEALCLQHPLVKSRMLADASPASKTKAARIDEALLPARPRPQTSMVLARRLLSGALGMKVNLTREEREKEARTIRNAKNHKRLVAKQKEDVWEGNI